MHQSGSIYKITQVFIRSFILEISRTGTEIEERDPNLQHRQAKELKIAPDNTLKTDKMSFHDTRAVTRVS